MTEFNSQNGHVILIGANSPRLAASDRSGFEARRKLIESGATAEEIVAKTFEFTKGAFSPHSREHNPGAVEKLRQEHLKNDPQSYLEMLQAQLDETALDLPKLTKVIQMLWIPQTHVGINVVAQRCGGVTAQMLVRKEEDALSVL